MKFSKNHELFRPFYGGFGHILKFHRVIPAQQKGIRFNQDLEVTPEELENCIKFCLERNYDIISLDDLYIRLQKKNNKLPNNFVVFTFDDGYVDCYRHAYPILRKYHVPFSVNISPGLIECRSLVWWYLLEDLLLHHRSVILVNRQEKVVYNCRKKLEKCVVFRRLRKQILNAGKAEYHQLLDQLFQRYHVDATGQSVSLLMTWEQIREMARDPLVTIAAHTDQHLPLSRCPEGEVIEEISRSREQIEQAIGRPVEHFAYPYGHREAGSREFAIVKSLGFKTGITTRFGNIFPEHHQHLESLPSLYKIGNIGKAKFLDVLTSGAISALSYKMNKVITV
jgi:peptidoglycan/xylan/chitin deacetylase (PgdA/CDA1 family)